MADITSDKWQIAGAGVAATALGAAGMVTVGVVAAAPVGAETISLRDQTSTKLVDDPVTAEAQLIIHSSGAKASLDSPLQSVAGPDSVDSSSVSNSLSTSLSGSNSNSLSNSNSTSLSDSNSNSLSDSLSNSDSNSLSDSLSNSDSTSVDSPDSPDSP